MVEAQIDAELARRHVEHAQAFGHDLLAYAVAGDHGDAMGGHGYSLKDSCLCRSDKHKSAK